MKLTDKVYVVCFSVCLYLSGDFLNESRLYEDILDMKDLKRFLETRLDDYNLTPAVVPMSLVFFRDAIKHSVSENTRIQTHPY